MVKLNSKEQNIFFTSDTHFHHKNITSGVSKWDAGRGVRDFETPEKMTDYLINKINEYIKEDDILIHLGDWSFDGIDKIWESRKRIVCKNIYLVAGNHDLKIIENKVLPNCKWLWAYDPSCDKYKRNNITDCAVVEDVENLEDLVAQELFNYLGTSSLIQIDKTLVFMSHFPSEGVRYDKRSIHVHGHVHGTYPNGSRLDVGIDNAFKTLGEYKPFSWEEVKKLIG